MSNLCEKTSEKTYRFYGIFSKFISSSATSLNFTFWKLLEKKIRTFEHLQKLIFILAILNNFCEKTWENLSFLWNIFKFHFKLYTFTKFYYLKKFRKKWTFWNCQEINIHFCIFEQLLQEKLLKGLSFLWEFVSNCEPSQNFTIFRFFNKKVVHVHKLLPSGNVWQKMRAFQNFKKIKSIFATRPTVFIAYFQI